MKTRKVETALIGKNEPFRILALAEALNTCALLVGDPGTGKTRLVLDYAKSSVEIEPAEGEAVTDGEPTVGASIDDDDIFILETDETTRGSAVKGVVNIQKLVTENEYDMVTPIADARVVLINEVDKANAAMRNSLLGVMNERRIFNGQHKVPCNWEMFVATCNIIPEDEVGNPFWDRFPIKCEVGRIAPSKMIEYLKDENRGTVKTLTLKIPDAADLAALTIPEDKIEKFIGIAYEHCSDRTLTIVPDMVKAVSFIWRCSLDKAFVKTAELLINKTVGSKVLDALLSPEMKDIHNSIQMIAVADTETRKKQEIEKIRTKILKYLKEGKISTDQIREIEHVLSSVTADETADND